MLRNNPNKIWFDTEFIDYANTVPGHPNEIGLLSIGLVKADGSTYYAQNKDIDLTHANEWVQKNVYCHFEASAWKPKSQIRDEVKDFCGIQPEFWCYFGAYDWVCMCQLFGTMLDLPSSKYWWPHYYMDIQQLRAQNGIVILPEHTGRKHHALDDAIWTKECHKFIRAEIEAAK